MLTLTFPAVVGEIERQTARVSNACEEFPVVIAPCVNKDCWNPSVDISVTTLYPPAAVLGYKVIVGAWKRGPPLAS